MDMASVNVTEDDGRVFIVIEGEVDRSNATTVFSSLLDEVVASRVDVVLDLSRCTYLDSAAVREVLRFQRAVTDLQRSLRLIVAPSGSVRKIFEIVAAIDVDCDALMRTTS